MKIRFVVFLLLMLIGMSGCVEPEIEVFGSISGVVKNSQTNKILEGVKVTLSPGGNSQITGQDGTFTFESLDQSEYTLSFVKGGYEDESQKVSVKPGLSASVQVGMFPIVPELELSTAVLDFGEELSTLSIDISNKGKGELKWMVAEDIEWLEASVAEGVTTTEKSSVVFTISRAALEEGNHMESFVISSNGGSATVMVMVGVATVRFEVIPAEVDFSTVTNTIQLTLKNLGQKSLEWNANVSKEWLTLSKDTGMITKEDYVNAIVSREGLSPGSYTADIIFVSDGGEISVPVRMEVAVDEKPTVAVESISGVSYNGAVLHGTMVSVGSDKVTRHGFCWSSTNEMPTIDDEFSNLGDSTTPEAFESVISNLSADTKYYVRAYAENSVGISYSEKVQTFTTTGLPTLPGVTTGTIDEITSSSARAKGKITSLGNVTSLKAYGHVWSTDPEPTLENAKSTDLGETDSAESFVSDLKELDVAANYYVRAYATNEKGTSYGEVMTFVTLKTEAKVETAEVVDIVHNAATAGGKLVISGGHKITERGVCWGSEPMPNMEGNCMQSGSSDDIWTCRITGLEMENTYYVRAYVKTSEGTVFYGADKKFTTTKEVRFATLAEVTVSNITTVGASFAGKISSNGNSKVTECGFCWSGKEEPTTEDSKTLCDVSSADMGATVSGLEDGKTYYVRAFATNAMGTAYSESVEFTTLSVTVPVLSAVSVTNVTTSGATFAAMIESNGNSEVTESGFCYSDAVVLPTINENKISCDAAYLELGGNVSGLSDGKTYYVRAFARNSKGINYSDVAEFVTLEIKVPVLSAVTVENVGKTSAKVSASVLNSGNSVVIDYGFCWSSNPEPKLQDTSVSCFMSADKLNFTTRLTDLPELSTVYVRAYAVNSKGVSYSEEVSIVTLDSDTDEWDGVSVADKFAGGIGTEANPIIVNSAAQLKLLADNVNNGISTYEGIYFKLDANINLANHAWTPMGFYGKPFKGHFDGAGHLISGLNISSSEYKYSGLFGYTSSSILHGINVSGTVKSTCIYESYHGGVVGYMENGKIYDCCNFCDISHIGEMDNNDYSYMGGICGAAEVVYNCVNKGNVVSNLTGYKIRSYTGGIGGYALATNCLNLAEVKNSSSSAFRGGINGYGSATNCMNYRPIPNGGYGISGDSGCLLSNCYWIFEPANNIGNQYPKPNASSGTSFVRMTDQCLIAPDYTLDLVEQLNSWVSSNSGEYTYKKWKYETVDGYACPVFDE